MLVSARSKMAYRSTGGDPTNSNNTYDAANILRPVAEALGLTTFRAWAKPPRGSPWPTVSDWEAWRVWLSG